MISLRRVFVLFWFVFELFVCGLLLVPYPCNSEAGRELWEKLISGPVGVGRADVGVHGDAYAAVFRTIDRQRPVPAL